MFNSLIADDQLPNYNLAVYVVSVIAADSRLGLGVVIACGIGEAGIVRAYTNCIPITLCAGVVYGFKAIAI